MISKDALKKQEAFFDLCNQCFEDSPTVKIYRVWLKTSVPISPEPPCIGKGFPVPCLYLSDYISNGALYDNEVIKKKTIDTNTFDTIINIIELLQSIRYDIVIYFPTENRREWSKLSDADYNLLINKLQQKGVCVIDKCENMLFFSEKTCFILLQFKRTRNNVVKQLPYLYQYYKIFKPLLLSIAIYNELTKITNVPCQPKTKRNITDLIDDI